MLKPVKELRTTTGEPYLTRWELIARRASFPRLPTALRWLLDWKLVAHRLYAPDEDRGVHNHPWFAICVVVRGSYWQLRRTRDARERLEHVRLVNVLWLGDYHRITQVAPGTLTLCLAGPRIRCWGFLRDGVHVNAPGEMQEE